RPPVIALAVFAMLIITVLALWHVPLPWRTDPPVFPPELVLGIWTALVLATVFIGAYTWSVAAEARRLRDAVAATQLALAREQRVRRFFATANDAAQDEPMVRRSPEVIHGINNLIQNALQFARQEVSVTTSWDRDRVSVEVADDGPGFPAHLLGRLGEPYLSTRAGASGHMGLGIFIAQSLLERSGAELTFDNLVEGGAHVVISWNRANLEAETRSNAAAENAAGGSAPRGSERQTA